MQNNFGLADGGADRTMPEECARQGVAFVPYFPLGGNGPLGIDRLERIAARRGASPARMCRPGCSPCPR
ncbi:hypothetical protein [Streptomyces sp. NPDC002133]|uniref:hypothetical protein n=1 Tax=Streptomyces sp. NPDC002133 TaxID=3154409 RepID=UPI0033173231